MHCHITDMPLFLYLFLHSCYIFACMTPASGVNKSNDISIISYLKCLGLGISKGDYPLEKLNFGVMRSSRATSFAPIYRSKALGKSGKVALMDHLVENDLPIPSRIVYLNKYGYVNSAGMLNLDFAIEEYENPFLIHPVTKILYPYDFIHPLDPANLGKSYIAGKNPLIKKEKDGFTFEGADGRQYITYGGINNIKYVLKKILESHGKNEVVLIHCKGGLHRTGMISYLLRGIMNKEWLNLEKEKNIFPINRDNLSINNAAHYEYYLHNNSSYRKENITALEAMVQQSWYVCLQNLEYFHKGNIDQCLKG